MRVVKEWRKQKKKHSDFIFTHHMVNNLTKTKSLQFKDVAPFNYNLIWNKFYLGL